MVELQDEQGNVLSPEDVAGEENAQRIASLQVPTVRESRTGSPENGFPDIVTAESQNIACVHDDTESSIAMENDNSSLNSDEEQFDIDEVPRQISDVFDDGFSGGEMDDIYLPEIDEVI